MVGSAAVEVGEAEEQVQAQAPKDMAARTAHLDRPVVAAAEVPRNRVGAVPMAVPRDTVVGRPSVSSFV